MAAGEAVHLTHGEAVHLGFFKSLISLRLSFFDGTPMSLCPYRDLGGGLAAGASPPLVLNSLTSTWRPIQAPDTCADIIVAARFLLEINAVARVGRECRPR